ncbi:hypothetical protein QF032_004669 [Streptomyces achromogenes]|uniref:hypothetical protein n=1 Tax=Streptomyces achromogenes TaxID=67255 RepID=UPI002786B8A9|nr:hypothetical protein [Streptomyces achromogenes]MDQ0832825.1 hypothetical protein [Streptomyces achromogenes]
MAWDEWEQLKSAAAERHGTQMQLNHVPLDPGGSGGTLVSNKPAWSKAGSDVGSLREDLGKVEVKLADGQKGIGEDAGCLTAAAQKDVYRSWETYVKNVGNRCGKLSGLLEKAGSDQLKTDEAINAEIGNMKVEYADTPAVGGKG